MKLTIAPSEKYPRHELEVKDWFAQKEEFYNQFKSEVEIKRETEKAFLIMLRKSGEEHWIPKSLCKVIKRTETGLETF